MMWKSEMWWREGEIKRRERERMQIPVLSFPFKSDRDHGYDFRSCPMFWSTKTYFPFLLYFPLIRLLISQLTFQLKWEKFFFSIVRHRKCSFWSEIIIRLLHFSLFYSMHTIAVIQNSTAFPSMCWFKGRKAASESLSLLGFFFRILIQQLTFLCVKRISKTFQKNRILYYLWENI